MADTTDTAHDRLVEQTRRVAENLSQSEKAANGVQLAFGSLFKQLVGTEVIVGTIRKVIQSTDVYVRVQQALSRESRNKLNSLQMEADLESRILVANWEKLTATGKERELAEHKLRYLSNELDLLYKRRTVANELEKLTRTELIFTSTMVSAAATMWFNARQFNQNLIEANSSFGHRDRLIRQTLVAQAQMGIGFDEITKSAAALVHYGMDTEDSFETNLRLVAQLEQGLGVSVNVSAQLASVVERQVHGSFKSVSDVISQIVNDTALAGDEAARLALNISTALGRLRPGLSATTLPDVVRLVGRYESALKEVGGQSGAFQQLLTQLTTPEGLVGAGALGVNPEFLATSQGVESVMNRFAKYGQMLVGQSQGWERQMRLQALAQIFNVTTDQANQMLMAIKRAQAAQGAEISTQDRWREQLNATNSGIQRLGNSLMGLLQGAMYPVIFAVGALANRIADGVEWLLKSKEVVYTIGGVLLAGTFIATARLWGLVRALTAVALSSTVAKTALSRYTAMSNASILASFAPTGKFMMLFGRWGRIMSNVIMPPGNPASAFNWVNRLPGMIAKGLAAAPTAGAGWMRPIMLALRGVGMVLSSSLLLWAAPLVYAGVMLTRIYNINKQSREDNLMAQKIILSKQEAAESEYRARIYAASRYGEASDVEAAYARLARMSGSLFDNITDPNERKAKQQEWLDKQLADVPLSVLKGITTRTMFTPMTERTPADLRRSEEMQKVWEKLLKVNEEQKQLNESRRKDALSQQQEAAIELAKARAAQDPIDVAIDFYSDILSKFGLY